MRGVKGSSVCVSKTITLVGTGTVHGVIHSRKRVQILDVLFLCRLTRRVTVFRVREWPLSVRDLSLLSRLPPTSVVPSRGRGPFEHGNPSVESSHRGKGRGRVGSRTETLVCRVYVVGRTRLVGWDLSWRTRPSSLWNKEKGPVRTGTFWVWLFTSLGSPNHWQDS